MSDWFSSGGRQANQVPEREAISVTQLVRRLKNAVEVGVGELWVEGEVSGLKKQSSGHWYFSLKDRDGQISCAMFSARSREGSAVLEDGVTVEVFAEATVYEGRGQLQLIVKKVAAPRTGEWQQKFEQMKARLAAEGLFDQARKIAIPKFPAWIGLVTSETGAVLQDMKQILARRAPWVRLVLVPVRVQGKGAEQEIARAIRRLSGEISVAGERVTCDALIVGRGGGSIEDLWCFNEEVVARAIAACSVPIISAVGHETDYTIADFVADLRAPTPSAAAELATPDRAVLAQQLAQKLDRLSRRSREVLRNEARTLVQFRQNTFARDPEKILREQTMRCDAWQARLDALQERKLLMSTASAGVWQARLDALQERKLNAMQQGLERLEMRLKYQHPKAILARQWKQLQEWQHRFATIHHQPLARNNEFLTSLSSRLTQQLEQSVGRGEQAISRASEMLPRLLEQGMRGRDADVSRLRGLLRALGPEGLFARGFSITRSADGRVLRSVEEAEPGMVLHTMLADGEILSRTIEANKKIDLEEER